MKRDIFRPTHDPVALELYDAFQKEAKNRKLFDNEWIENERNAVWETAKRIANQKGLREPSIEVIERYENNACGHVDYGKKWAIGISEWMQELVDNG